MKILIIANNTEGNVDGIGKHARMLSEEFDRMGHHITLLSSSSGFNKFLSFVTLSMSIVYLKALFRVVRDKYDYIIIEYPFKEHNPFIVVFHIIMYYVTRRNGTRIAFSMHEYDRVNIFRKKVIDVFLRFCDLIFVSEEKYFNKFPKFSYKMRIRTIPNHIVCSYNNKEYNPVAFCFFGLVNRSKAFKEMLDAWDFFNRNGNCTLEIISSSDLKDWNLSRYKGITYHYNLSENEVVDIMFKCSYSILPVVPSIGYNNSSFVSSIQCGCVPIGKFSYDLCKKDFVFNVENYDVDTMVSAFSMALTVCESQFNKMSAECREFGKNFSLKKTAIQMMNAFEGCK